MNQTIRVVVISTSQTVMIPNGRNKPLNPLYPEMDVDRYLLEREYAAMLPICSAPMPETGCLIQNLYDVPSAGFPWMDCIAPENTTDENATTILLSWV